LNNEFNNADTGGTVMASYLLEFGRDANYRRFGAGRLPASGGGSSMWGAPLQTARIGGGTGSGESQKPLFYRRKWRA